MKRFVACIGLGLLIGCGTRASDRTAALPPVRIISPDTANEISATFSPDWSRVYWWQSSATRELWTADTTFANPKQLPASVLVSGVEPVWSPDGTQFAVPAADTGTGITTIMVMAPDGSNARRLPVGTGLFFPVSWTGDGKNLDYVATFGGSFRAFTISLSNGTPHPTIARETRTNFAMRSPDGSRVAYLLTDKGQSTVWVADSAGEHPRQLTTDGFESFAQLGTPWSPDGKWIAFESRRTGTSDIWVVSPDSGAPKQLTHDVRNDWWPVWSPDSRWIAFLSDRGHQTDVWVVPAASGMEQRVTDDAMDEEPMQWRKGTLQFAYLTGQGSGTIWSMSLADSTGHQLTPDSIYAGNPNLSPDGSEIAFRVSRNGGVGDLAVIPSAGGPMRIVVAGGSNSEYQWSPDGKRLAIISDRGGTPDLWIVDVASGTLSQLENWPGVERTPVWSGDGSAIYFMSDHDARLNDVWRVAASGGEPVRVTTEGNVNSIAGRTGVNGLYVSLIQPDGQFHTARVADNGKLDPVWTHGNTFPADVDPTSDSIVIAEVRQGGGFGFRMVPIHPGGEGRELLATGEQFQFLSNDGKTMLYTIPSGATTDIGLMDRATATTRRLTNTPMAESAPQLTPDGKTVIFRRSRAIRRIAIADLTKLLGGMAK